MARAFITSHGHCLAIMKKLFKFHSHLCWRLGDVIETGRTLSKFNKIQLKVLKGLFNSTLPVKEISITIGSFTGSAEEQWLVLNVLGGGTAKKLAIESRYNGRGYVPWAGVAAQIAKQQPGKGTETTPAVEGQAFTFLPLPVKTGLPIHVCLHSP